MFLFLPGTLSLSCGSMFRGYCFRQCAFFGEVSKKSKSNDSILRIKLIQKELGIFGLWKGRGHFNSSFQIMPSFSSEGLMVVR